MKTNNISLTIEQLKEKVYPDKTKSNIEGRANLQQKYWHLVKVCLEWFQTYPRNINFGTFFYVKKPKEVEVQGDITLLSLFQSKWIICLAHLHLVLLMCAKFHWRIFKSVEDVQVTRHLSSCYRPKFKGQSCSI